MVPFVALALVLFAGSCYGDERIVGGYPTTIDRYPSIVQVEFRNTNGAWGQSCAANILNEYYVLSAAHCFEGVNYHPSNRRIRAGTTYRNEGGVVTYVLREYNHPSYRVAARFDGDITVIRLASFMSLTPVIQQGLIVAPYTVVPDGSPVVHAGWGATSQGGPASSILLDTTIYTISNELCRVRYLTLPTPGIVTENMICAGLLGIGGRDACQGDSGGPLYYGSNNVIIGVVSWGHGCANETFPGLSTAVSPYTNWVRSIAA